MLESKREITGKHTGSGGAPDLVPGPLDNQQGKGNWWVFVQSLCHRQVLLSDKWVTSSWDREMCLVYQQGVLQSPFLMQGSLEHGMSHPIEITLKTVDRGKKRAFHWPSLWPWDYAGRFVPADASNLHIYLARQLLWMLSLVLPLLCKVITTVVLFIIRVCVFLLSSSTSK